MAYFIIFHENVTCLRLSRCEVVTTTPTISILYSLALITVFFLTTHPSLKVGVLIIKIKFLLTHLGSPCSTSLITDMQVCVLVWSYLKAFAMASSKIQIMVRPAGRDNEIVVV